MVKKSFAILLVLIANITMLAQSVVPHHHHSENEICIETSHCESEKNAHDHSDSSHDQDHEHDGSKGTENCFVHHHFVTPSQNLAQNINLSFNTVLINLFKEIDTEQKPKVSLNSSCLKTQTLLPQKYTSYSPRILGLRGSPQL